MGKIDGIIDGKKVTAAAATKVEERTACHFIINSDGKATEIFLTPDGLLSDGNTIDGIEVTTESEKEKIVRERFAKYKTSNNTTGTTKGMILKASMPGMVKAVSVSVGDITQKSTQVIVLEAMKMENSITAGFSGKVTKIHVEAGMSVEKNAFLMEFSPGEQ